MDMNMVLNFSSMANATVQSGNQNRVITDFELYVSHKKYQHFKGYINSLIRLPSCIGTVFAMKQTIWNITECSMSSSKRIEMIMLAIFNSKLV